MQVEVQHDGSILIYGCDSAGYLVQRRYMGYRKSEAIKMYLQEVKNV